MFILPGVSITLPGSHPTPKEHVGAFEVLDSTSQAKRLKAVRQT